MTNKEKIHDGHRQRLINRFLEEDLDHFNSHQVLELMLFYCIPRQDTNPIAHALLDRFGSLAQVMQAPIDELQQVNGIGEKAATFLTVLNSFCRYYDTHRSDPGTILDTSTACANTLIPYFNGVRNETVYLLCLDAKCMMLCCRKVGEGSVNSAAVPIRRIVEVALGANATTVVLAHNHPSGIAVPSPEDVLTTKKLAAALAAVDITLTDHIVVADGEGVSLRDSRLYDPADCQMYV